MCPVLFLHKFHINKMKDFTLDYPRKTKNFDNNFSYVLNRPRIQDEVYSHDKY